MSHVATKWAFDQPELHRDMKPGEWAVLMVLADCHNPVNGCYPSQEYICSKTNLADRTVRDQLAKLRGRNLVNWEEAREDGRRAANRYSLAFEADFLPANSAGSSTGEKPHDQPAESDTINRQNLPPYIAEPVKEEPVTEPSGERSAGASEAEKQAPDPLDADWQALKAVWPDIALEAQDLALGKLSGLTPSERKAAIAAVPVFLAYHREKRGKAKLPYLVNYLGEKRWVDLPKGLAVAPAGDPSEAKHFGAFDREWWWLLIDWITLYPALVSDHRTYPGQEFNRRVSAAKIGIGWRIEGSEAGAIEGRAASLVKVMVGSPEAKAWADHWHRIAGVRIPMPDVAPAIFMPSEYPPDPGSGSGAGSQEQAELEEFAGTEGR